MDIRNTYYSVRNKIKDILSIGYAKVIIDMSKWQCTADDSKLVDFDKYEESDSIFTIIKASQGTNVDKRFAYYVVELVKRLLGFGAYHFGDIRFSAVESAKFFANQVLLLEKNRYGIKSGKEITKYWLDVEKVGFSIGSKVYNRNWIRDFLTHWDIYAEGIKIGIYTSKYAWETYIAPMDEIHERKLWVANYEVAEPKIPNDWARFGETWLFWQYCVNCTKCGSCGANYGAASVSIDSNKFNGTIDQFYNWLLEEGDDELSSAEYEELKAMIVSNDKDIANNTSRIEVLEEAYIFYKEMRCTASPSLRMRTAPETGSIIGNIPHGASVLISSNRVTDSEGRGDWIYSNYNGMIGWCAGWYLVPV